jgi:peptidoglycan/xylan/chitin deacetylase (PgdA/CDA1 family)
MKATHQAWLVLLLAALTLPGPAQAETRASLQAACWPASALAGVPGVNLPVRANKRVRIPNVDGVGGTGASRAPAGVVRRVALPPGKKLIALTFDLCETPGEVAGYEGGIVDYLRAQKVKATFFAGGHWMASHGTRTQQLISDPLFEIGTHGWAHRNTRRLRGAELRQEILAPSVAYATARAELSQAQCATPWRAAFSSIPQKPSLIRFPSGSCNAEGLQAVADAGMIAIQWDFASGDPAPGQSARAIANVMLRHARPGSIIVAHANGRGYHTAEALPVAIPALRAKGFEFVTVSELLAAGKPVMAETCYDARPGDTDGYDLLTGRAPTAPDVWKAKTHVRSGPTVPP